MASRTIRSDVARDGWRMVVVGAAALFTLYVVLFEQGALTRGQLVFHEVFHDARHLLAIPCH